jgi:hypothetical protein
VNFIKNCWRKILAYAVAGSTSIVIAACYGSPNLLDNFHWKIKTKTKNNQPINGLQVELLESVGTHAPVSVDTASTDSLGEVWLFARKEKDIPQYSARITDIDSTLNGGSFRDTIVAYANIDSTIVILSAK